MSRESLQPVHRLPAARWVASPWPLSVKSVAVASNNDVSVDKISLAEVRNLFLGWQTVWSGGGKVVKINAKEGSPIRAAFRNKILRMTREQEGRHWKDQKVRKGLRPPVEFGNVLKAVFKLKRSVSYVYRSEYKPGVVKVLAVVSAN